MFILLKTEYISMEYSNLHLNIIGQKTQEHNPGQFKKTCT